MRWLGLDWDEGPEVGGPLRPLPPVRARRPLRRRRSTRLRESRLTYDCYCTTEEVEARRKASGSKVHGVRRLLPRADRRAGRGVPGRGPAAGASGSGCPTARSRSTTWSAARSPSRPSSSPTSRCCRANGDPLYTLVNPVDDALMEITHVLRGEDLLSSTPRQIALYDALQAIGVGAGRRRASATCPTSWARATRSSPSATREAHLLGYRDQRASCPRACSTTWPCSAGRSPPTATSSPSTRWSQAFDIKRRQPQPGALRPQEGRGDQRLAHAAALARGHDRAGAPVPRGGPAWSPTRSPTRTRQLLDAAMPLVAERINKLTEAVDMLGFLFVDEDDFARDAADVDEAARRRRARGRAGVVRRARGAATTWSTAAIEEALQADAGRGARAQAAHRVRPGARRRHRPPGLAAAVRVPRAARPRPRWPGSRARWHERRPGGQPRLHTATARRAGYRHRAPGASPAAGRSRLPAVAAPPSGLPPGCSRRTRPAQPVASALRRQSS